MLNRSAGIAVILAVITATLVARQSGHAAELAVSTPTETIALFDGASLEGWSFISKDSSITPASIWSVQQGAIRCSGKPNGYARTLRALRDYQLHVEWRWPASPGNSGIFLHITGADGVWPQCLEVQLKANDAGTVRANGGAKVNELDLTSKDPKNVALRVAGLEKPIGQWNTCEIICRGDTVTVSVNGIETNRVTGSSVSNGPIGLQAEGAEVEFRQLLLQPLPRVEKSD